MSFSTMIVMGWNDKIGRTLEDFARTRDTATSLEDDGQISCTSVLQQWNRPRKRRLDSKMVEDISFQNEQYGFEPKRSPVEVFDP